MYSCHFIIFSSSVSPLPFLSFILPIHAWNGSLISLIILKRALAFSMLLSSSISLHWSIKMVFSYLLAILWNSAFSWVYVSLSPLIFTSLLASAICKLLQTTILPSCILFSLWWIWSLPPIECYKTSVHSSSVSLSIRFNPLKLYITCTV